MNEQINNLTSLITSLNLSSPVFLNGPTDPVEYSNDFRIHFNTNIIKSVLFPVEKIDSLKNYIVYNSDKFTFYYVIKDQSNHNFTQQLTNVLSSTCKLKAQLKNESSDIHILLGEITIFNQPEVLKKVKGIFQDCASSFGSSHVFNNLHIYVSFHSYSGWQSNFKEILDKIKDYNYQNYNSTLEKYRVQFGIKLPVFINSKGYLNPSDLYFAIKTIHDAELNLFIDTNLKSAFTEKKNDEPTYGILNLTLAICLISYGINQNDFVELLTDFDEAALIKIIKNGYWKEYVFDGEDIMLGNEIITGFSTPFYQEYINDLKKIN